MIYSLTTSSMGPSARRLPKSSRIPIEQISLAKPSECVEIITVPDLSIKPLSLSWAFALNSLSPTPSVSSINKFDGMGYSYCDERSNPDEPVFIRKEAAV